MTPNDAPACSLDIADMRRHAERIRALAESSLLSHELHGETLTLSYRVPFATEFFGRLGFQWWSEPVYPLSCIDLERCRVPALLRQVR